MSSTRYIRAAESRESADKPSRRGKRSTGPTAESRSQLSDEPACYDRGFFAGQTSPHTQELLAEIQRVAARPFNILITGETGTGNTYAAREIHRLSTRCTKPFLELNCANLPEHLVEAELFGYRKGAFTGADHHRKGLFEEADGGILFLDEIGDISSAVQSKLLRAIEEKQIKRLGTNHYRYFDVQIIAATSRNLHKMIEVGLFREDLHCRLAVLTIETAPLRNRREDIPALIAFYLREAAEAISASDRDCGTYRIDERATALLCEYDYPGNIRALRNLIYELTSYINIGDFITEDLVLFALGKANNREQSLRSSSLERRGVANPNNISADPISSSPLAALVNPGDIVLL
ncbi:MAG TPA: sigma 54-interacting transcriptional regulator [Pyrinomonadaceae bacterium]|nr:sigma 54-interacting transcriptional regulator [Pyrinomonadaceae bacterium]